MAPFRAWRVPLILAVGVALGLAWNAFSGRGIALASNVLVKPGDETIPAPEAKKRLEAGALFLDARPKMNYDVEHIPGALNLPEESFDQTWPALEPRVRDSLDVVVYCAGFGCEASHEVARKLKKLGVPAVVLDEGWPAWQDAGYPIKSGPQP